MSRRPRITLDRPCVYYHVMTRTAQQELYFKENVCPGFKEVMIRIFQNMADIYYIRILAWVIMDNHYHLCLQVEKPPKDLDDLKSRFECLQKLNRSPRRWQPELADACYGRFTDLSRFMSSVNSRIARAFNRSRETQGHLWGSRFKSKIIENESSLLKVMSYIEQNPVKAGLSTVPSEYPWCSAGRLKSGHSSKRPIDLPAVGFLSEIPVSRRAPAYVEWVDDLACQMHSPAFKPPKKIHAPLSNVQLQNWRREFEAGEPEDWSSQAFGSTAFHLEIALKEQAQKNRMTNRRTQTVKRRRKDQNISPSEPFQPAL